MPSFDKANFALWSRSFPAAARRCRMGDSRTTLGLIKHPRDHHHHPYHHHHNNLALRLYGDEQVGQGRGVGMLRTYEQRSRNEIEYSLGNATLLMIERMFHNLYTSPNALNDDQYQGARM